MLPAKKENVVMALPESQSSKLPIIAFNDKNLPDITKEAFDALTKANNPPYLFKYGNSIVRLVTSENDQILIDVLDMNKLTYEAVRAAVFGINGRNGFKILPPPSYIVYDMLAEPDPPLPVLRRIVNAPIFSTDGKLQTSIGYSPSTKYYLNYNDASVIRAS